MNPTRLQNDIDDFWDQHITPTLTDYIAIPALSVDFDPLWATHGQLDKTRRLALSWLQAQVPGHWRVMDKTLPGKTPLLLVEIPSTSKQTTSARTTLIYGHLDKQPEMEGWWEGFGPWTPVLKDNKLYGRGGADDGYALFAAVAAVKAIEAQGLAHDRIVILIEFSEESGSPHLPPYLKTCADVIGSPDLVIALDSGAGDYQRLWSTTSLRGMLGGLLKVEVLNEATHSGIASGIVPSSMRIMRLLLERLEDAKTGEMKIPALWGEIPAQRIEQAKSTAKVLGDQLFAAYNVVPGLQPVHPDNTELLLNNTWRPTLSIVGQEGMPRSKDAGNVTRAYSTLKLSFRLPPNVSVEAAKRVIREVLTQDPPYQARISIEFDQGGDGWNAPALAPWLERATAEASRCFYGEDAVYFGLGASIPFMGMLGQMYPAAQFLITGVLGPKSNAHGPNEFIDIAYAKKLTACIGFILAVGVNR